MRKYTKICCDRVNEITTNSYNEVVLELEDIDLGFMFELKPEEIAKNCDLQKVLDYLDEDFIRDYVAERFNIVL